MSDFAAWIVDTQNEIVAAIESILKEILIGVLHGLALAAISGGLADSAGYSPEEGHRRTDHHRRRERGDSAGGAADVPGSRGAGEIPTPHGRPGSLSELNAQQVTNYERYVRNSQPNRSLSRWRSWLMAEFEMSVRVPANNVPGSYAEYIKIIDRNGEHCAVCEEHVRRQRQHRAQ